MKARSTTRWIWAGALWTAVFAAVCWNSQRIDLIASIQDRNHALRQEALFLQQYGISLARIQEHDARSFLLTDSFSLGILTVQSAIRNAAEMFGMPPPRFSSLTDPGKKRAAVMAISAEGPPESVVRFLFELQRFDWLEEKQVIWKRDSQDGLVACELEVMVRFQSRDRSIFFSSETTSAGTVF